MKKCKISTIVSFILLLLTLGCKSDKPDNSTNPSSASATVFDGVLFYDGYASTVSEPVKDGVIRLSNSRYVTKIPPGFINAVNSDLTMEVIVKASCDNYDRIGNVFLSLIKKGEIYDKTSIVYQIEIARFITPFMDKNKTPQEVPYLFEISNIAALMKDAEYSGKYDFWMEFELFGVPYAANKQIAGCAGRNDTFYGSINLFSGDQPANLKSQLLFPLANFISFNNYKDTDVIGRTVKSIVVNLSGPVKNAKLYLITSNHGSNSGGEEYNRRDHFVYFNDQLLEVYKPGGKSCEPYRIYNTQSNGIYGSTTKTESTWASFSNWCPGDRIPTRIFALGNLSAGINTFKIEVPEAKFIGSQGDIPLSAYIQGDK